MKILPSQLQQYYSIYFKIAKGLVLKYSHHQKKKKKNHYVTW